MIDGQPSGKYKGSKPKQGAQKGFVPTFKKLCEQNPGKNFLGTDIEFEIIEYTKGPNKNKLLKFIGRRELLPKPITVPLTKPHPTEKIFNEKKGKLVPVRVPIMVTNEHGVEVQKEVTYKHKNFVMKKKHVAEAVTEAVTITEPVVASPEPEKALKKPRTKTQKAIL